MKKYRTYPKEFIRELISDIDSGQITVAQAAREHTIARGLIDRWRKQIHEGTFHGRKTSEEKHLEKELDYYKKKVAELTRTVDLLKKIDEDLRTTRRWNGSIVTGKKSEQSNKDVK